VPKLSKEDRQVVENTVEAVIVKGQWSRTFAQGLARKYGLTEDAVYKTRQRLFARWASANTGRSVDSWTAEILAKMEHAYGVCLKDKDRPTARGILNDMARITGVSSPEVIEHRITGHNGGPVEIDVKVDHVLTLLATQMSSMRLDQLAALGVGQEVLDGDAITAHRGGNGGGRPLLVPPGSAEEAPDGDTEAGD